MKKRSIVFVLMALYTPQLFAAGAISRVIPSGLGTNTPQEQKSKPTSTNSTRSTVRTQSSDTSNTVIRSGTRAVNLQNPSDKSTARTSGGQMRSAGGQSTTSVRDNLTTAVETVGRNARVNSASINNNPIVRRAGVSLRPTTAEVGGRATIGDTNIQTGSNIASEVRSLQSRAATTTTRESIAEAKERLEQTADLNKSCQEQYNDCMDQFCAVIDANQKRCSCSANLSKYTKVEEAVKDANTKLNDVAQRIRYVGLSADEIRAIMSATEAEEALSGKSDTTETRTMLEKIESMIKDPTANVAYSADTGFGLDLDLDFSANTSDLFSLDFLNTNTNSFSNLRGTELYNAAKKRCNTVLNQCKSAGGTPQQITGNYDLAIDKDCIAYEQGLTKMNESLATNVRSANLMLQKARLAVLQNKNQYDAKGCIAALDTCMKDDMVCGDDYSKCLDPTKRYIDENGNVVLGRNITDILAFMKGYNNAIDSETLGTISGKTISEASCKQDKNGSGSTGDGSCNVKYLLQKIGTGQKATDGGLCRPVLDKCQYYTYTDDKYNPYNDIVINYIQRAMVNIRAAQYQIISDYASNCMVDIATCYNQQVTQVNTWSSNASAGSVYNVMRGACYNVALTCAYAVFQNDTTSCPTNDQNKCIESISEMFYQSLLCPDNSTFSAKAATPGTNGCATNNSKKCYVNARCYCNSGYEIYGDQCVVACANGQTRDAYGSCVTSVATAASE